jgi:hypothetical protein
MSITLAQIEQDFADLINGGENFVIGVYGAITADVKAIEANLPAWEAKLQAAAVWLDQNGPALIEAAADTVTVAQAAGLTHGVPQAQAVISESTAAMTAYQQHFQSGAIPVSAIVSAVTAYKNATAAAAGAVPAPAAPLASSASVAAPAAAS